MSIWDPTMRFYKKNLCNLGSVLFEGLKITQRRSKHFALTIYYFNIYEINCCVIDWHVRIFCLCYNTSRWQTLNLIFMFVASLNKFKTTKIFSQKFLLWGHTKSVRKLKCWLKSDVNNGYFRNPPRLSEICPLLGL